MAGYDKGHNARMRKNHEDAAEIAIDPIIDSTSRAKALADPVFFIEHCCAQTLRHKLPVALQDFARQIVTSVQTGANCLVVLPRGAGKTTVLTDTLLYCIVAKLVHFPVIVAATQAAANNILKNVWKTIEQSPTLHECFPELTSPVRALQGKYQRATTQHIQGVRTNIRFSSETLHLPDVDGVTGATLVARGSGGSVRGLLSSDGSRPDFIFLDDPQKASSARSATQLDQLETYINADLRGLGGSDSQISIFVAATPMAPGDIVERLSRRSDVLTIKKPLVAKWPKNKDLWDDYTDQLYGDLADGTTNAHQFYLANQADMDDGAEVLDPLAYPAATMSSAIERAYYLKATMGDVAFRQEYMLTPPAEKEQIALDPVETSKRLSMVPHRTVPAECSVVLASIDVGTATALHVSVVAFGRHLKASVIDAYRFPDNGRLVPKGLPQDQQDAYLVKALVGVVTNLIAPGRYRQEATGKVVPVTAIAIDRGYRTNVVDQVAAYFARRHVAVYPAKGFSNQQYHPNRYTIGKAENVDLRTDDNKRYLAFNADTLKALVLQAFRGEPLTTGSLSLWGDDASKVYKVAAEIAGEKLMERIESSRGTIYRYAPSSVGAQNHHLDAVTMCIALATWMRYRDPDPTGAIVASSSGTATPATKPTTANSHHRIKKRHRIVLRRR